MNESVARAGTLWETETTEHGFEIVWATEENRVRARDHVIGRLEGAGIQVREVIFIGTFVEHLAIEFRGEAARIAAPLISSTWELLRLSFANEEPDPENLRVGMYFGPQTEDYQDPHLYGVSGTIGDIIALIQY